MVKPEVGQNGQAWSMGLEWLIKWGNQVGTFQWSFSCRIPAVDHVNSVSILLLHSLLQAPLPILILPRMKHHKCPWTSGALQRDPEWLPLCLPTLTSSSFARTLFLDILYTNKTTPKSSQSSSKHNSAGKCRAKMRRRFHFLMPKKDCVSCEAPAHSVKGTPYTTMTCHTWSHILVTWTNLLLRKPGI